MLHQILHITMVMWGCFVLEQNDTMLKQLWLFMAKSQPHLIMQQSVVILANDHCSNWHGMV